MSTDPERRRWLGTAAAAAASACGLGVPRLGLAQPTVAPDLQALLTERVRHEGVGLAGFSIAARAAPPRFAAAGSVATTPDADKVTADTRFEWGSITKTLTALLLADCVQRRELALDDPLEAVLPRGLKLRDSAGQPLRWVDVATHRSGLPRLPANLVPPDPTDPYAAFDRDALWAAVEGFKAQRQRDAQFEYSNFGFGLLGELLALRVGSASGATYASVLRERVLGPLGLGGVRVGEAGMAAAAAATTGIAQGHNPARSTVPTWRFRAMAGAGALGGSARELARYAQCVLGGVEHPLREAIELAARQHSPLGPSAGVSMGLAWIRPQLEGRLWLNHDGGTFGSSCSLFIDPVAGVATGVLANAAVPVADLALHTADPSRPVRNVAAERAATAQAAVPVAADALAPLAGVYALNPQFKLTVRARGERLFAQATGQGEFELFALDAKRFFARVTALEVEFEAPAAAAAGAASPALVLRQSGQRLRFVRE